MHVRITPRAADYARRALAGRPELNHTLTVSAFLVGGCCSPNLPPEVHLGPPADGGFRAVTVPLPPAPAGPETIEVYVDPLVEDFVRDWYGEEQAAEAARAVLCIDLAHWGQREELTVAPWPPRPDHPPGHRSGG